MVGWVNFESLNLELGTLNQKRGVTLDVKMGKMP